MNPDEYQRMFDLEDNYWWFVARRQLALACLQKYFPGSTDVLDLGCGTGAVLGELQKTKSAIGIDMSELALRFASTRNNVQLVRGDGTQLPFLSKSFDAIIGLDVFEHIEDHQRAFHECSRILKPGGILILSVPAFKSLWGPHDVALHHFRRYRRKEVDEVLLQSGLTPVKTSYSVFFLFPVVTFVRLLDKFRRSSPKTTLPKLPAWLNKFLIKLQSLEGSLLLKSRLPWGSSVVAVARKPGE